MNYCLFSLLSVFLIEKQLKRNDWSEPLSFPPRPMQCFPGRGLWTITSCLGPFPSFGSLGVGPGDVCVQQAT